MNTKIYIIQKTFLLSVLLLFFSMILPVQADAQQEDWITIFNGKDLTGWIPKVTGYKLGENPFDTFRVVDGLLTVSYDKYPDGKFQGQFGHLFYKTPLSSYKLRLEFRFTGKQLKGGPGWAKMNSGIMLHCLDPETMKLDTKFPTSFEYQFLGRVEGAKKPRVCGSLFLPGGRNVTYEGKDTKKRILSRVEALPLNEWVKAEAIVSPDGTVRHMVNGKLAIEYSNLRRKDGSPVKEGYISLQSETHPVQFRNIKLFKLK